MQADADGKESKWADIDDDEDDWAPETIEWNDGTKIDLSQNNPAAILAEEQARAMVEKARQEEERKSKLAAQQKPTTTVGPNATVLKPRSAAQTKSGGVVLKATSEKPTLVAKPSAPAPVRSPWASLPPIDKVPPIDINPPGQPSPARPQPNESNNNNSMAPLPAPPPAMEIAADDFTRIRRDNQNGNLGQLYNAQSGQYEPANAGRRGSVRKDQSFRPPSLLQRGSQYDQQGPAEPSAAFQTHRSGSQQDHPSWTRRGSSTVSGDSGPPGRRTSMNKGSDVSRIPHELQQRRESQPLVSPLTPGSKHEHQPQSALQSPAMHHSHTVQEARSATESPFQSRIGAADAAQPVQRDEVAAQRALMKEKRELAIKRKKEEEERDEAAKKERIRIKMEKLGMAPLEERNEKQEPEKKTIEKRVPEAVMVDKETEKLEVTQNVPQAPAHLLDPSSSVAHSPPKPPVLDVSGTPQKSGLMRLHANTANNIPHATNERVVVEQTRSQSSSQKTSPPELEPGAEAIEPAIAPMVNGVTSSQKHPDAPVYRAADNHNQNAAREPRQQSWNNSARDQNAYGGWNGQNLTREQPVSSSVWGPTSQSRALGNGTFGGSIQRPQSRPQDQFSPSALAPIGPPRHLQRARDAPELRPNDIKPVSVIENFQTVPSYPPSDTTIPPFLRPNVASGLTGDESQALPSPIEPNLQRRPQINGEHSLRDPDQQKATLAAWSNFKVTDAERNRQLQQQHAARLAEDLRNGIQRPQPQLPIMNETWRQVKIDDQNSQRHVVGVLRAQNTHDRPIGPQINGDIRPSFVTPSAIPPITAAGIGRGSRFFPNSSTGLQPHYQGAVRFPLPYRVTSPPLPDDEDHFHPAYFRDQRLPLVKLPGMQDLMDDKTPKVRLPPTIITPVQSPQISEVRAMPFQAASQPLVNNPSWQDRFNGLLGVKKTSPERKFAIVADGFSATKVPLDSPLVQPSAAVSLPPQSIEPISRTLEPASRLVEDEEELFENREFGSLPAVSIPTKAPEIGWMEAKAPKRGQLKQSKTSIQVEAASKDTLAVQQTIQDGSLRIFINLLGMGVPKSIPVPGSSIQSTKPGIARQRNGSGNSKPNKGYRSRESPGNFGPTPKSSPAPPRNTPQSGPHLQSQGQPKNHPAWGPRTASAVH